MEAKRKRELNDAEQKGEAKKSDGGGGGASEAVADGADKGDRATDGDIGEWQPNGTMKIVDHKKNISKLSQGEYEAVENLENDYSLVSLIDSVCFLSTDMEEIVFEILKELPVKTLVRFRAVCKLWCSIIDDPIFIDSHRTRSYTRTDGIGILCQYKDSFTIRRHPYRLKVYSIDPEGRSPVRFPTLPLGILDFFGCDEDYRNLDQDFISLQSVNGLICRKYCIWNPSTRQSIDLPPVRVNINCQFYDVRKPNPEIGVFPRNLLGFDSVSKQYKVVNTCDISFGGIRRTEFRILTLGRDSYWRNLDSGMVKLGFRTGLGVCCIDDVIFCSGWVDKTEVVVAFEVGPEKFRVIPLPGVKEICSKGSYIIQVGGRLGFVSVDYGYYLKAREVDFDQVTNVKDYHKHQWKKEELLTFPTSRKDKRYGIRRTFTAPMGSIHTSEILFCSDAQNENLDSVYSCSYYDPESKRLRMVPMLTEFLKDCQHPKDYGDQRFDFTKHVECLFRLKAI
ncbi:hypothetical protein LguiA_029113 [Lonicera macranthoides]